jgi:hypothetical protein
VGPCGTSRVCLAVIRSIRAFLSQLRASSVLGSFIDDFPLGEGFCHNMVHSSIPLCDLLRSVHNDIHRARHRTEQQVNGNSAFVPRRKKP